MKIGKIDKKKLLENTKVLIDKNIPLVANLANLSRLFMDSFMVWFLFE